MEIKRVDDKPVKIHKVGKTSIHKKNQNVNRSGLRSREIQAPGSRPEINKSQKRIVKAPVVIRKRKQVQGVSGVLRSRLEINRSQIRLVKAPVLKNHRVQVQDMSGTPVTKRMRIYRAGERQSIRASMINIRKKEAVRDIINRDKKSFNIKKTHPIKIHDVKDGSSVKERLTRAISREAIQKTEEGLRDRAEPGEQKESATGRVYATTSTLNHIHMKRKKREEVGKSPDKRDKGTRERNQRRLKVRSENDRIKRTDRNKQSKKAEKASGNKRTGAKSGNKGGGKSAGKIKVSNIIASVVGSNKNDNIVKSTIKTYLLSGLLVVGGKILLVAIPFIIIIAMLYSSPLAVFLPQVEEGEEIRTVLSEYYSEFNEGVASKSEGKNSQITFHGGEYVNNYMDTLMVYMVKYGTGADKVGTVMDNDNKQKLKQVFEEMNYYRQEKTTYTVKVGESLGRQTISAYCGCRICTGKYYDPNATTASGAPAQENHTLAVDAYNPLAPLGTTLIIDGEGEFVAQDTGNLNAHGRTLDRYYKDHNEALAWGVREKEVFLSGDNDLEVTQTTFNVYHLTFEDYIKTGKLSKDQTELLREVMNPDIWSEVADYAIGEKVAQEAMTKIGCKYSQDRRTEPGYYDCSSLVYRLYQDVAGVQLPGNTDTQLRHFFTSGMLISESELQPGDLIYYSYTSNGHFMNVSHVSIYVGGNKMVHASNPTRGVVLDPLEKSNIGMYVRPY